MLGYRSINADHLENNRKRVYEYLYVMVFDNSDVFVKVFRVYVGNKIYFAEQLAFDINEGLNNNTGDLSAGGIFNYAYSSATRTSKIKSKMV